MARLRSFRDDPVPAARPSDLGADLGDDGMHEDDTLDPRPLAEAPPPSPALADPVDDLAARALLGDNDAWNTLIQLHNAAVIGVIMSYRVPRQRAEELAQEAWVKLYLKVAEGLITVLKLPGLVLREAGYRALDEKRRKHHAFRRLDAPLASDEAEGKRLVDVIPDATAPSPERSALVRDQLLLTRRIFLALPDRQRQVAWLSITKGLSHAQVAEHLDISARTSKFTLSKARIRMRTIRDLPDTPDEPMREAYLLRHADLHEVPAVALRLGVDQPRVKALLTEAFGRIKSAGGC